MVSSTLTNPSNYSAGHDEAPVDVVGVVGGYLGLGHLAQHVPGVRLEVVAEAVGADGLGGLSSAQVGISIWKVEQKLGFHVVRNILHLSDHFLTFDVEHELADWPSRGVRDRPREEIQILVAGLDGVGEGVEGRQLHHGRPVAVLVHSADSHDEGI